MERAILILNQIQKEEWISTRPGKIQFLEGGILSKEGEEECMLIYCDKQGRLKHLLEKEGSELNNTYELNTHIHCVGTLEIEIGLSKYYMNGTSEPNYYRANERVCFLKEGIESLYLTLRLKNRGEAKVEWIGIGSLQKLYLNEKRIKIKRIEQFYEEWSQRRSENKEVYKPARDMKVGAILDEFSWECFKYEANFLNLTYGKWEEELEVFKPEILLVESAWQGKAGTWTNRIARYREDVDEEVKKLISYCQKRGIVTVFWDKEGLKNFHYFIGTASLFDYVGVTDENVLPIHGAMRAVNKVFILPFAAQPRIHHDQGKGKMPLGNIAFAGAWYGGKYPERIRQMEKLIQPAKEFGLDIYDRNYDKQMMLADEIWKWPEIYNHHIIGKMPYEVLLDVYKQYKIFLNVQSISDSKWMIPRRVYEILACGIPIISSPSEGIDFQFREDIYVSRSEEETRKWIIEILAGGEAVQERVNRARRKILREHTYAHRLETILKVIQKE